MDKVYNHKEYEEKIYDLWEKSGAFSPKPGKNKFSILLPPPNANAPLHYGHAMYTVEDVLIRFHRMLGDETLWLPGADHAGFETQVVYEKYLEKEGKSRFDYNRETLYKNIWDFVHTNRGTMEGQLRRLGFSLDWEKLKFTLDPDIVKIVYKTFKKLYDADLIYRDARLVNYCTKHGTAFSDLEVQHIEKTDKLYFVDYKVKEGGKITVATTRPETIFGDVAIAINPKDKRYKDLIDKTAINPFNGRLMPIITDDYVEKDFGTGALKITPAHDENDFELGRKYKLDMIQVVGFDGRLNEEAGEFKGLKVLPAREAIEKYLKEKGLLSKTERFTHTVGTCYKCGNILEPLPLPQWYIKTKELAKPAIEKVKNGKIKIIPKRFEKIYFHWMNNIHDWNISRQVVWGIRIPAWQCNSCNEWTVTIGETPDKCGHCKGFELTQDNDTFDTWFSSGQWPFATLGFPDGNLFKKFYPVDVMETGYDILFFWVARMIMLGIFTTGKIPFRNVYLHGIVRDSKGQKMSKSKGNVINPLEIVEKFGADALRMSLIAGAGAGNDQNYSESKIIGYRNFTNKLWNIARFIEMNWKSSFKESGNKNKEDSKLFEKINELKKQVTLNIKTYKFSIAALQMYDFVWNYLANNYLENNKDRILQGDANTLINLKNTFLDCLKLLHPFMPYVTEAIYQGMFAKDSKDLLINSPWPTI